MFYVDWIFSIKQQHISNTWKINLCWLNLCIQLWKSIAVTICLITIISWILLRQNQLLAEACGVASGYGNYLAIPKQHKTLLFWWTPDNSFLDVNPSILQMPPHSAFGYSQGDQTSATVGTELAKMVSSDLRFLSPDIAKFLESVKSLVIRDREGQNKSRSMLRPWKIFRMSCSF